MKYRPMHERTAGDRVLHPPDRDLALRRAGERNGDGSEGARRPPPPEDRQPAAAGPGRGGLRLRGAAGPRPLPGHRQLPPQAAARRRRDRAHDKRDVQLLHAGARGTGLGARGVLLSKRPDLARRAAAEAIGAFALVFAGCGAIVTDAVHRGVLGAVGVSLVFGLVIMAMVYATGHLSGAD